MNKNIKRLKVGSGAYNYLSDALERVIDQPRGVAAGNHAALIMVMQEVFNVHLTKGEAVKGAVWALWRENDIFVSDDPYIQEFVQERDAQAAHDDFYSNQA